MLNAPMPALNPPIPVAVGTVTSVRNCKVTVDVAVRSGRGSDRATVGRLVGLQAGDAYVVGVITELTSKRGQAHGDAQAEATLELVGEIGMDGHGRRTFCRGVADYPAIGDAAEFISRSDLRLINEASSSRAIEVGRLQQDPSISALIDVDELISRHFAVLGSTGVGKSSAVAVILNGLVKARRDLRIFLLDVHNEYGRCFGRQANVVGSRTLKLPFWLLNFEETVDVVYGGRPAVPEEVDILLELIPIAKSNYDQYKTGNDRPNLRRADARGAGYTVDTPVPYILQDLLTLIDERMGRLENRASRMHYHRLMARIETLRNDPRYAFMFENANVGGDMMGDLVAHLFRVKAGEAPMTVMQLGGLPAEAMDAIVSVLCRLAFEFGLWSEGAVPLLFVCEEAHRYASADTSIGFGPTRRALARIAKEGRKNGVFLGLVTQRPAELDPTIISQCGTLFAMRMANDRDQALLASAVTDGAANLLAFVPSLGTREAVAFGEGVTVPSRLVFSALPESGLPRGEAEGPEHMSLEPGREGEFMRVVLERWRGSTMSAKGRQEEERAAPPAALAPAGAAGSGSALDLARSRILKRHPETGELGGAAISAPPPAPAPFGSAGLLRR